MLFRLAGLTVADAASPPAVILQHLIGSGGVDSTGGTAWIRHGVVVADRRMAHNGGRVSPVGEVVRYAGHPKRIAGFFLVRRLPVIIRVPRLDLAFDSQN